MSNETEHERYSDPDYLLAMQILKVALVAGDGSDRARAIDQLIDIKIAQCVEELADMVQIVNAKRKEPQS